MPRSPRRLPLLALVCALFALAPASASAFTVATGDDSNGHGPCTATCTLRQAIEAANGSPDADTILIPVGTVVKPTTPLPAISAPVSIEGTGAFLEGPGTDGLTFAAGSAGSSVHGLDISGFTGSAVSIAGDGVNVEGNTIHGNGTGVSVLSGGGNLITKNALYGNTQEITLENGANNNQAHPVITSAETGVPGRVTGTLDSHPDSTYNIELFLAGNGEYLTTTSVTTDALGHSSFDVPITPGTGSVTATATDVITKDTSAFAVAVPISAPPPPPDPVAPTPDPVVPTPDPGGPTGDPIPPIPPAPVIPLPPLDTTAPLLSNLSLSRTRFRVAKAATAVAASAGLGTTIRYTLSEDTTVTFIFERVLPGRARRGTCVAAAKAPRHAKTCKRYSVIQNALTRRSKAGPNAVVFSGRLGTEALKPGSYRLGLIATDGRNNRSPIARRTFAVVTK